MPFSAFKALIPATARTIFVLSEDRQRAPHRRELIKTCDSILEALFSHLTDAFPEATILNRRGDDVFADFARLTYSPVTVCSPSTFCLYPALIHKGTRAYFPLSPLVLAGNRTLLDHIGPRVDWFESPKIVLGYPYRKKPQKLLELLLAT